jgi:hypothetical protein
MIDRQIIETVLRVIPEINEEKMLTPCKKRSFSDQRELFTYLVRDIWWIVTLDDLAEYFKQTRTNVWNYEKVYSGLIEFNRTERERYEAIKSKVIAEMLKTGLMA